MARSVVARRGLAKREEFVKLESFLRERGLKMTASREAVLAAFLSREGHLTADELCGEARRLDPGIGQATVFRTIKLLEESGLAREAYRDEGARSYEHAWRHEHHDHLRCVKCGAVVEFTSRAIESAQAAIYRERGYEPVEHHLELLGTCPECLAGKKK